MISKKVKRIGISAALVVAMAFSASTMAVSAAEAPTNPPTAPADPIVHDDTTSVEVNNTNPDKADDYDGTTEVKKRTVDPTAEDDPDTAENEGEAAYDTDIDVWGFTEDATVYSVDVEWGAMTFRYTTGTWDPETHQMKTDATSTGWEVYDSQADKALGDIQHEINRVTVTNHSNADVWAKLTYEGSNEGGKDYSATVGEFSVAETPGQNSDDTGVTITAGATEAASNTSLIALKTANNGTGGAAGTPTKGVTYFKPKNISDANKTNGITKWTTIGKITVAVSTTDPTPTPAP